MVICLKNPNKDIKMFPFGIENKALLKHEQKVVIM